MTSRNEEVEAISTCAVHHPYPMVESTKELLCGADRGGRAAMAKRGQALRKARAVKRPAKPTLDPKQRIAELERELALAL